MMNFRECERVDCCWGFLQCTHTCCSDFAGAPRKPKVPANGFQVRSATVSDRGFGGETKAKSAVGPECWWCSYTCTCWEFSGEHFVKAKLVSIPIPQLSSKHQRFLILSAVRPCLHSWLLFQNICFCSPTKWTAQHRLFICSAHQCLLSKFVLFSAETLLNANVRWQVLVRSRCKRVCAWPEGKYCQVC